MSFRNISAWCIRNPVAPIVLFIGLTLAGLISFSRMAVVNDPPIEFPAVAVLVSQPGAAPTEIETQITQRVEAAIRSINGVDEINSQAREGSSQTTVQFQIGVDPDNAVNEVKNAVDQIRSDLPEGILEPQVVKIEVSDSEIAYFAVSATDMTIEQLSWFVDDSVAKRLLSVPRHEPGQPPGRRGSRNPRDSRSGEDAVARRDGRAGQSGPALGQSQRRGRPGRNRRLAPVGARAGQCRQCLRFGPDRESPWAGGRTIHLSDIAAVYDGYGEQKSISKVHGQQVVTFSMNRSKTASDVSVYDDSMKVIADIEKENPGIHFTQLFTSVDYTKDQYNSSIDAMVEGAVLAVVVVFIFLPRLARDGDQRRGDPAFGDPDLLVPRSDRLQSQPAFPARAEPGRRCAGR